MNFIDCHSHLSFLNNEKLKECFNSGASKGIEKWVMGGYNHSDWIRQLEIKKQNDTKTFTSFAIHPWEVIRAQDFFDEANELKKILDQADFIGETGLDLFVKNGKESLELQKSAFEFHLNLKVGKPYILHIVQAHGQALEILKNFNCKGYVHSFSGSYEVAKQYIDQGFLISFGPNILNKNFIKARESLKKLPLDRILVESDTPASIQDQNNPVETFFTVAEEVAKIRNLEVEKLLHSVNENFNQLLSE